MADTWYVKTRPDGVVLRAFLDDDEKPEAGDIKLNPKWYYGRTCGLRISDIIHGERFTVKDGRLVPRYTDPSEIESAKLQKRLDIENHRYSPLLSAKRKARLGEAKQEVENHMSECINTEEVRHTLLIGY
jgi:hypothetical protein